MQSEIFKFQRQQPAQPWSPRLAHRVTCLAIRLAVGLDIVTVACRLCGAVENAVAHPESGCRVALSSCSPYTLARTRWHGSRKVRDRSLIRARSREEAHRHQRGRRVQPRTKSRRGPVSRFCQGATGAGRISARLRSRLSLLRRRSQGRLIAVSSRRVGENIWSTGPTPICQDLPLLLEERLSSSTKRVWLRETTLFLTWFSPPSRWQ